MAPESAKWLMENVMILKHHTPVVGDYVTHPDHRGVAFRVIGHETEMQVDTWYEPDDEGDMIEVAGDLYEAATGRLVCVMVGDDYRWYFEPSELNFATEYDFCHTCGQTGCTWDRYEE